MGNDMCEPFCANKYCNDDSQPEVKAMGDAPKIDAKNDCTDFFTTVMMNKKCFDS